MGRNCFLITSNLHPTPQGTGVVPVDLPSKGRSRQELTGAH
jgi:hypothetical protein